MKIKEGLTFDDVLLVPKKSDIKSRKDVDTSSYITKNVKLNIPMISLNMATVTESEMAIAMAREGGIGIIHRFMPIKEQALEVKKVKRSIGKKIEDPITVYEDLTLRDAIEIIESNKITALLVINKENKLIGILTQRDFVFEKNLDKKINELMTKRDKLITATENISVEEAKEILEKNRIEKLPLVDSEDNIKGLITTKAILHLEKYKNSCRDSKGRLRVAAAIGVVDDYLERAEALVKENVDVLVVDIAHAHSNNAINAVKKVKENFDVDVLVGNVATEEGAKDLIKAGADGIKVGIGNGTICTTREVAGAGVPQLTALEGAIKQGRKNKVPIISDGGIAKPGNFSKAVALGCSAVMFGSIFAGTEETPGPILYRKGKQFKQYHGSTSYLANVIKKERESKDKVKEHLKDAFVEGVESLVPFKGPVSMVINQYMKGLMSGMSYCGASNIKEMWKKAEFVKITQAGKIESGSHDVLNI